MVRALSYSGNSNISYVGRSSHLGDPVGSMPLEILYFIRMVTVGGFSGMFVLLDYL